MFAKNISVMISEKELADRVAELGKQITEDYRNRSNKLLFVGILKGSVVFLSDLIRAVDLPLTIDFMIASSYGSQTTSDGVVTIRKDIAQDLTGYDIIIVARTRCVGAEYAKMDSAFLSACEKLGLMKETAE